MTDTMPGLFDPYTLRGVTLRNRIGMSPMTMYSSVDGKMNDYHLMYLGARAAGGFGLIFPEQVAILPEGRTSRKCAGIWDDNQIEGHARVTSMVKEHGGVSGIQLGHTGRNGSERTPWEGGTQIAPDDPMGWQVVGPSEIPYGCGKRPYPVHALTKDEIKNVHRAYQEAARRSYEAGYEWIEMHFAHGYLGASFWSPLANQRDDEYGGSSQNRIRFHLEALDAVREVWPDHLPLTMRLGSDDFHPDGVTFDESVWAIAQMKEHGLDMADISMGGNTDDMDTSFFPEPSAWVERARRVKDEVGIPMTCSWNLGVPANADAAIRSGAIELVLLGRPALSNPHWPVWAARELGIDEPFDLVPEQWAWWLKNFRGHAPSIGWPEVASEPVSTLAEVPDAAAGVSASRSVA